MRKEANREVLAACLSIPRNRSLYERLRDAYATLPVISHGWDHIHRCAINAVTIGETERCRIDIVFAGALLHDIGFIGNPDPIGHHERGAAACATWLDGYSESEKSAIASCVYRHKGEAKGFHTTPTTIEEKIVCDADLLEKVGYTGMFQSIVTYVEFGATCWPEFRSLERILAHLAAVEDVAFYTRRARELAEERGGTALARAVYARALEDFSSYYTPLADANHCARRGEDFAIVAESTTR
jgi:HD superfamily phosphodiesterase